MTKKEYIKEYNKRLEKKINEITDAYDLADYTQCEFCPLSKDGESCIEAGISSSCINMLYWNIDDINEVE